MRMSKFCILACCAGACGMMFLAAPVVAQQSEADQQKALEALRKAEAEPAPGAQAPESTPTPAPVTTPAPAAAQSSVPIAAPQPAMTTVPGATEQQAKELEALHQAESQPVTVDKEVVNAPSGALPETVAAHQKEAQFLDAQRQRKLAEEKAVTDRTTIADAAKRQQEEDDQRVKAALDAEKAATEKAREDLVIQAEAAKQQQAQDDQRIQQAIVAEKDAEEQVRIAKEQEAVALEKERIAKEREEAAEKARLFKLQQEAAEKARLAAEERDRIARARADAERLKLQMQNAPRSTPPSAKEEKLADLLRRYQADQITPYEYHVQRAKIIAEP